MKTVVVIRDGVIKLRIPAEIQNGILRTNGGNILINSDLIQPPHTKASVAAAMKSKKITPEIEAMGMRIGDNGNGLVVRWADDLAAEEKAKRDAEYNALPAEIRAAREERLAIDRLFSASHKSLNRDTDDNNVERGYQQLAQAEARLKVWREKHPEAAKEERRQDLLAAAAREEDLASGAMTYDSDGWLGTKDQIARKNEFLRKAADLRNQAAQL